ncbi:TetR/AcrR family transcriptional regulator [Kibdelosporangium phytohabitans]|uniref:TetR family transcriptional regulator n=1 Tax=Kibdelosporangium phytohabitans TaxID=860235 RepID=A0A0N9HL26_9PSEU|nr:TetR family transcriptional regulator [Kibdelosporangium phytohabitans]ALG06771.1 TetR family transcriptional regulator [Kibdelosporangium phytohabitans]MBE1468008.1 AcrR family transcriptional regulator [Kibdelosporangium phytohabitans]
MARRSDLTRQAILDAARERFAADGYERATIRAIAADAGIDPAMVMRYYGNKEKLFSAAAEFDLRLPDLLGIPREDIGATLARHVITRWEGDETLLALLRAGVTHESVAERMRAIFAAQLGPVISTFDPDRAAMRAGLVSTQVLGFVLCRYVLKFPPVVGMSVDEVVRWLGPTLQRYLTEG